MSADELLSRLDDDSLADAATMLSARIEAWEDGINTKRGLIAANVPIGAASSLHLRRDGQRWRFAYITGLDGEFNWLTACPVHVKALCAPHIPALVETLIACRDELFREVMAALDALSNTGDSAPW